MKKAILIIGVLVILTASLKSQTLISTAGGSTVTDQYQVSWSVGEVAVSTYQGDNYIVTEGFHQSWAEVSAIDKFYSGDVNILLYPNPVINELIIEFKELNELNYKVYDLTGALKMQGPVENEQSRISFSELSSGTYMVQFYEGNKQAASYKVVKY